MTEKNKSPFFAENGHEILTTEQMISADTETSLNGTAAHVLMGNVGRAVVVELTKRWRAQPTRVLCGPGNNGGDGFVIARLLKERGWPVKLSLLGNLNSLSGDALRMAKRWKGETEALDISCLNNETLIVDALFGAGLTREVKGPAAHIVNEINERKLTCVAVDIPSGVAANTGEILGVAPQCELTVTFFRKKPGHLLYPGRGLCGQISLVNIGISEKVLTNIKPNTAQNDPKLWLAQYPWPQISNHKFTRGSVLIAAGALMTGATRLAARAASRIGAGVVTIASSEEVSNVFAGDDPSFLVKSYAGGKEFASLLKDERLNTLLIGPGAGVKPETADLVLQALGTNKSVVLDADALTVFKECQEDLFKAIPKSNVVLTPHDGEFSRLFDISGDKLARCRKAAEKSGAVVLLKGPDTVIAAPDGRAIINCNAPPTLATAGAGDVLAGLIAGLLAQGMNPFFAASAACWVHGRAAIEYGPGLIASDLPEFIPTVLKDLKRCYQYRNEELDLFYKDS